MRLPPLPLFAAGLALMMLCAGATVVLARSRAAEARVARTRSMLEHYQQPRTVHHGPLQQLIDSAGRSAAKLAWIVGIQLKYSADFPCPWWVVPIAAAVLAYAVALGVGVLVSIPQYLLAPVVWGGVNRFVFSSFASRRKNLLYRQFPDALGMIVRGLRVGQAVAQALRSVARDAPQPTAGEFARLSDRLAIGVSLPEALTEMARESGVTEYRFFATALVLQSQTGGSLSEALDILAEVIRNRLALRKRAYALASEARTSAIVLGILPAATGAALMLVSPDYARLLVDDHLGRIILSGAILMLLTGMLTMRAMIRKLLQ